MTTSNGFAPAVTTESSDAVNEIATALAKAQADMPRAAKLDKENPYHKSRYASLASIVDAVRGPLTDQGIAWTHQAGMYDGHYCVRTKLLHASGQYLATIVPADLTPPGGKGGPQQMGSAVSYARRYGLSMLAGIAADSDDDGNAAQGMGEQPQRRPPAKAAPPPQQSEQLRRAIREIKMALNGEELHVAAAIGQGLQGAERQAAVEAYRARVHELKQIDEQLGTPPGAPRREPGQDG